MTADLDQLRQAAHAASVARQERDEAIRAAIADGAPLRAVATAAGLSVAGVARIRDRARDAKKPPVCSTSGAGTGGSRTGGT